MKQERALGMLVAAGAIASLGLCPLAGAAEREVQRVLVISVDGLHAVDAERFIASHPQSALAEIASSTQPPVPEGARVERPGTQPRFAVCAI